MKIAKSPLREILDYKDPILRAAGNYYQLKSVQYVYMDDGGAGELAPTIELRGKLVPVAAREFWGMPLIKKIIFNDPATIILWSDGTKTVVKAHNEPFDPEKGLAMAISNRFLTGSGINPHTLFRKANQQYADQRKKQDSKLEEANKIIDAAMDRITDGLYKKDGWMQKALERMRKGKSEENPDK